ncbi:MAG: hypothetical protein JNJ54_19805 [Myxococcaceae bacterium]|nr:hypothetical protein [Myxococcaceae bacterium]
MAAKKSGQWAKELKSRELREGTLNLIEVAGSPELLGTGHRCLVRARRGDKELTSIPIEGLHPACHFPSRVAASRSGVIALEFGGSDQTRLVVVNPEGKILTELYDPRLADVMSLRLSPSGDEVVVVIDTSTGGTRVPSQILHARVAALASGLAQLAECTYRPAIAFDDAGRLCWLQDNTLSTRDHGQITAVKLATDIDRATLPGVNSTTTCGFLFPGVLQVQGERCVAIESFTGGSYFVFNRAGTMLRTFHGLLVERLALLDHGRKLLCTAAPAKDRTGSADWVPWPDPRMREAYLGVFDTDTGAILSLTERGKGCTRGFAAMDDLAMVASDVRGGAMRVETFPLA